MSGDRRFLAFAGGLTALVGLLAGVLSQVTAYAPLPFGHDYLDAAQSDLAALLALRAVDGTLLLAPLLYLLVPALVVLGAPDGGDRRHLALAVAALLVVPALAFALQLLAGPRPRDVAIIVVVSLVLVAGLLALRRFGAADGGLPAGAATLGVVFAGLLLVSAFAGGFAGARVADDLSDSYSAYPPQATFDFEYDAVDDERGVLVVQHDGGLEIPAEELSLYPEPNGSFVAVAGANQTEAGRWQGSTTAGDGRELVAPGDAVAVGLPADCESVRVVWDGDANTATIAHYDCPASR